MGLYASLIRPLAFLLDPETVHHFALRLIASGRISSPSYYDGRMAQNLFGVDFPNPLGLAAGFDKNAQAVERWAGLGFGFAEVGTITHLPQPGNDRPRLFRLPTDRALINRMGFNNDGAEAIATRLAQAHPTIPIGINLGKSKVIELARAPEDYRESFRLLQSFGAYFVVNVSSPNTPGLRSLQERGPLLDIIDAIREVAEVPLFVKVSPDLEPPALDEVVEVARERRLTGLIATNTTISRPVASAEAGGLSGAPLRELANRATAQIARSAPELVLIAAGGIFNGDDLYEKISLGAHLAQIYTGWVYGGPGAVPRILRELAMRMDREGIAGLSALRGAAL